MNNVCFSSVSEVVEPEMFKGIDKYGKFDLWEFVKTNDN